MRRRVALTGATGFIGRHVSAHLLACGDDVSAIVRPESTRPLVPGVTPLRAPLERDPLADVLRGIEVVVNLGGVTASTRPVSYEQANVAGALAVALAARAIGARLVHISSLAAAGPAPRQAPRAEADPPAPITPYGRSKLAGERAVMGVEGLRWSILRPAVVYGPGDRALLPVFRWAERGILPVVGRRDAAYTFVHVSDVVRAIDAAIAACADGDTLFVGHERPVTSRELFEAIREATGHPVALVRIAEPLVRVAGVLGDIAGRMVGRTLPINRSRADELFAEGFVCRVDRLRDRLGIVASVDLREGMATTAEWYRREGWLSRA